jgi:hypothetical protein
MRMLQWSDSVIIVKIVIIGKPRFSLYIPIFNCQNNNLVFII